MLFRDNETNITKLKSKLVAGEPVDYFIGVVELAVISEGLELGASTSRLIYELLKSVSEGQVNFKFRHGL